MLKLLQELRKMLLWNVELLKPFVRYHFWGFCERHICLCSPFRDDIPSGECFLEAFVWTLFKALNILYDRHRDVHSVWGIVLHQLVDDYTTAIQWLVFFLVRRSRTGLTWWCQREVSWFFSWWCAWWFIFSQWSFISSTCCSCWRCCSCCC